jgi:Holliday junction resolvase RusA-like endonuclease
MKKIVIPLPPVTKKNHPRLIRGPYGEPKIIPSKQFTEYQESAAWYCHSDKPISEPVTVKCLFYMPTHRRVDLTNLLEAIDDVLVHTRVLEDDNSNIIVSHDGSRVLYDKEKPRTEVYICRYE